jgi:hypothetical protein
MKEKFMNTMVSCAAIVTFGGSSAAVVNGLSSIMDYKVSSVLVSREQSLAAAKLAAESETSVVGTVVNGTKKLIKSLN